MKDTLCLCQLADGRIVEYDLVDDEPNLKTLWGVPLRELGKGRIYSIDGVHQHPERYQYFYVKTELSLYKT